MVRAVVVLAALGIGGELLLPTEGLDGLALRLAVLALAPPLLVAVRVVTIAELQALKRLRTAR
jgi:hypothetical protein